MPGAHPAIELQGLTKTFGSIVANKDIDLTVYNGEILALLGENGSGKTTLMNMLSGIYRPDAGHIRVNGKEVHIRSPHDAIALGIGMIHQHFKLVDVLSVQDNIVLGTTGHYANRKQLAREIRNLCDRFGLHIDPARKIYSLSVSEKQTVEILKVLYRGARTLVLDEPTAVLTPQEIDRLFAILRRMRDEGCAIIIITHKLNEVLEISDRVTILRKGHCIGTVNTKETTARELTERMVGAAVDLSIHRPEPLRDAPMLDVHHLTVVNGDGVKALDDVNFSIAAGEILGVAGVAGSGQKELCEAIAGLQPIAGGAILCQHVSLEGLSPREIIRRGVSMSFIPEDRLGMGLVPSMGMVDNMLLKEYQNQPGALVDRAPARDLANRLVKEAQHLHAQHPYARAQALRRQCAKSAARPRDRLEPAHTHHRLSRARPGHQFVHDHLSHAQRAKAEGRGRALYRRGSGRAARTVRPHHGSLRRKSDGHRPCAGGHQGTTGPDDDGRFDGGGDAKWLRAFPCA